MNGKEKEDAKSETTVDKTIEVGKESSILVREAAAAIEKNSGIDVVGSEFFKENPNLKVQGASIGLRINSSIRK
jgi:hypothetical protein